MAADAAPIAVDVAVVGGGLAGLTLARDVHRRGRTALVLEASSRLGGVIRSEHVDGVLVEGGPDAMLAQKPAALALCRELGLADEIVSTESPRTAFVLADGRLHAFPPDTRLGLPLTREAADGLTMLSADERARVARDFDAPAPPADVDDESVGAFTTRRFGEAFTRRSPSRCSAGSTPATSIAYPAGSFPRWRTPTPPAAACSPRWRRAPARPMAKALFAACAAAWASCPRRWRARCPVRPAHARAGRLDHPRPAVSRLAASGLEAGARAVVLAVPAAVAARLVAPFDATLAGACDELRAVRARPSRSAIRAIASRIPATGWASSCRAASRLACSRCPG